VAGQKKKRQQQGGERPSGSIIKRGRDFMFITVRDPGGNQNQKKNTFWDNWPTKNAALGRKRLLVVERASKKREKEKLGMKNIVPTFREEKVEAGPGEKHVRETRLGGGAKPVAHCTRGGEKKKEGLCQKGKKMVKKRAKTLCLHRTEGIAGESTPSGGVKKKKKKGNTFDAERNKTPLPLGRQVHTFWLSSRRKGGLSKSV